MQYDKYNWCNIILLRIFWAFYYPTLFNREEYVDIDVCTLIILDLLYLNQIKDGLAS